ncbi:hypothetical protein VVD49_13035 [Uliginosibacterium sp. H3]|uniref:DUF5666 domain-containing protein n=1 Tax=Uliginosibacterium silvisoli TaxID=3114758 RepID=A0ABU6K4X9_9RHOO|nr:hypothetical protein [Uliginosibacterium sp. H3]
MSHEYLRPACNTHTRASSSLETVRLVVTLLAATAIASPAFASTAVLQKPGAAATASATTKPVKGLLYMPDEAVITVDGKRSTAGALKRQIDADLAQKAGPPKTVSGGTRQPAQNQALRGAVIRSTTANVPLDRATAINVSQTNSAIDLKCNDKGPPAIAEVEGHLKPGGKTSIWGRCFGELSGRVEMIGQFPNGKIVVPFTKWSMTSVEIEMPASIRGAADHAVAVTLITADGKVSLAKQAQFVAARERIEVSDRLWNPSAGFELSSTVETLNTDTGVKRNNPAQTGQIARSLRVNPQCALDNMEATVLAGNVTRFQGWEAGPANEASVTIDWVGTCINTTTTTNYHYVAAIGGSITISSACKVAFATRAWAYCPVGIAP